MTQSNSTGSQQCDNSLPTYEAAIQQRNEVVFNVADIVVHNERAPLITTDSSRPSIIRPPSEPQDLLHNMFRQNALPAFYQAANAPRNGQIDRCQTYKNIAALILAIIATGLTFFIIVYGHENFNPRGY